MVSPLYIGGVFHVNSSVYFSLACLFFYLYYTQPLRFLSLKKSGVRKLGVQLMWVMDKIINRMTTLKGKNWTIWEWRMDNLWYCEDIHEPLTGVSAKPTTTYDDDWKKMDQKPISFIYQWPDNSIFHHAFTKTTPKICVEKIGVPLRKKEGK